MTKFEQITVSSTAIGVTASLIKNGNYEVKSATITAEGGSIRVRTDGTNPTSAVGHLIQDGDIIELDSHDDIVNFKAIRKDSTDGVLNVTLKYGG